MNEKEALKSIWDHLGKAWVECYDLRQVTKNPELEGELALITSRINDLEVKIIEYRNKYTI